MVGTSARLSIIELQCVVFTIGSLWTAAHSDILLPITVPHSLQRAAAFTTVWLQ